MSIHIKCIPYTYHIIAYTYRAFCLEKQQPASCLSHTPWMASHVNALTVFFTLAIQHDHHQCWWCQGSNLGALQTRHFSTKDNVTLPKTKTMSKGHRWSLQVDKAEELRSWKLYPAEKYLHCKFGKPVLLTPNQKAQQIHRHVHSRTLGRLRVFRWHLHMVQHCLF